MICPHCRGELEESIHRITGKWFGYTRCRSCDPSGKWEPRGVVEIVWPPRIPQREDVVPKTAWKWVDEAWAPE